MSRSGRAAIKRPPRRKRKKEMARRNKRPQCSSQEAIGGGERVKRTRSLRIIKQPVRYTFEVPTPNIKRRRRPRTTNRPQATTARRTVRGRCPTKTVARMQKHVIKPTVSNEDDNDEEDWVTDSEDEHDESSVENSPLDRKSETKKKECPVIAKEEEERTDCQAVQTDTCLQGRMLEPNEGASEEDQSDLDPLKMISVIIRRLEEVRYPSDASSLCLNLQKIMDNNGLDYQVAIGEKGGIDAILKTLDKFNPSSEGATALLMPRQRKLESRGADGECVVARNGCAALGSLALNCGENALKIVEGGGVELVLKIMRVCHGDAPVQAEGCATLCTLVSSTAPVQSRIIRAGGIPLFLDAVCSHPTNKHVQQQVAVALCLLAGRYDGNPLSTDEKTVNIAIAIVLDAMGRNADDACLQEQGARACAMLIKGNEIKISLETRKRVIEFLSEVMQNHNDPQGACSQVMRLLSFWWEVSVKLPSGHTVSLEVSELDRIDIVKGRIKSASRDWDRIAMHRHKLFLEGRALHENTTLLDSGVSRKTCALDLIEVEKLPKDHIDIFAVNFTSGSSTRLIVNSKTTVYEILQAKAQVMRVPAINLSALCDGEKVSLENTVAELELEDGDQLDVMLEQRGGCVAAPIPASFAPHINTLGADVLHSDNSGAFIHNRIRDNHTSRLKKAHEIIAHLSGSIDAMPVLSETPLLDQDMCQSLIRLIDTKHSTSNTITNDFITELSMDELVLKIGKETVDGVIAFFGQAPDTIKVRRVEPPKYQQRPNIVPFHTDHSLLTLQVALNDGYEGGKLTFVTGKQGFIQPLRPTGYATVHSYDLVHGVSQLTSGVRYGLFFCKLPQKANIEDETFKLDDLLRLSILQFGFFEKVVKVFRGRSDYQIHGDIARYLDFIAQHRRQQGGSGNFLPSLMVELVWRTHMLDPHAYLGYCAEMGLVGDEDDVIGHDILDVTEYKDDGDTLELSIRSEETLSDASPFTRGLCCAVRHHVGFMYRILEARASLDMSKAMEEYKGFLLEMRKCAFGLEPSLGVDLVWHTHQQIPQRYHRDCLSIVGHMVNHRADF